MPITIQEISDAAISSLKATNYQESSIYENTKLFGRLLKFAQSRGQLYYTTELGTSFCSMKGGEKTNRYCKHSMQLRYRCIEICNGYLETGVIELKMRKTTKTATPMTSDYKYIFHKYLTALEADGKQANTIASFRNVVCKFLMYLESQETVSLNKASAEAVNGFISDIRATWAEGSIRTALSALRSFFKYTGSSTLCHSTDRIRPIRQHKIIPVLSDGEEQCLSNALTSNKSISKRDRAIILISLLTGMRACDIVEIRMKDIDWQSGIISIVQRKTGNLLSIPLLPVLGNAIFDYIMHERLSAGNGIVFLREIAPYVPLCGHPACYAIIRRVMRSVKMTYDGKYCGTRLLRHNAASKMLRADTPIETISAVMGHADPDSTDIYITTDSDRLRECCLPIPLTTECGGGD